MAAVVGVSCVDKKFVIDDIKDIDPSIDFAPNGINIPLATIKKTYLKDLLENQKDLTIDLSGGYVYRRSGTTVPQSMDAYDQPAIDLQADINAGLSSIDIKLSESMADLSEVDFPGTTMAFDLGLPNFDFAEATAAEEIQPDDSKGDWPSQLNGLRGQQVTQAMIDFAVPGGVISDSQLSSLGNTKDLLVVEVDIPQEISRINTVWLSDKANSTPGCLITMSVDLGGLQALNGGAVIDELIVSLPQRYTLVNHPGHPATLTSSASNGNNNVLRATNISMGLEKTFDFQLYVAEVDLDDLIPSPSSEPGMTYISTENADTNEKIQYEIHYSMTLKPGTIPFAPQAPSVRVSGQPVFKDASFSTNAISQSFSSNVPLDGFVFEGIHENITKVDKIAFSSATVNLTMSDLGLPFSDTPTINIKFPSNFNFTATDGPKFTAATNTFHLTTTDLSGAGYPITIDYIRFGTSQGIPDAQGKLDLSNIGEILVTLDHTFAPATFTYSVDIEPLNSVGDVEVGISAATFTVNFGESQINVSNVDDLSQPVHVDMDISQSLANLPEQVLGISNVVISPVDDEDNIISGDVQLALAIDIEDPLFDQFYMENVRIVFPDFVRLKSIPYLKANNVYERDRIVIDATKPSQVIETFTILGFRDISVTQPGGTASLEGKLSCDFRANAPDNVSPNLGANMKITPKVTIPKLKVSRVEGSFEISLDNYMAPEDKTIDLSEVYDFFDNGNDVIPGLDSPIIKLDFNNPTGINMNNTIMLTPKNKAGHPILPGSGVIEVPFSFSAGENHIYITRNGASTAPAGYTGFDADLSRLFTAIPYSLEIDLRGGKSGPGSYIEISEDPYMFEMDYLIEMPLHN